MANLSLTTADKVEVVESLEQHTAPAAEAITAGMAVRLDTSTGYFTKANASSAAEARRYGIATRTVVAGQPVTAIRRGVMDGWVTTDVSHDDTIYLSDTDGRIADAAGTVVAPVGRIIGGHAVTLGTTADKILLVDCSEGEAGASTTLAVTDADGLTVGGVIVPQHIEVSVYQNANAACLDECFFIANRAYQVTAIKEVHAVAGNDSSAVNLQVTKDTGTDAPGAGTDLLTNNTNAGFDLKATANTVQSGTLVAVAATLQLAAGDRLSLDYAGNVATLAGVVVTVSLKRI